MTLNTLQLTDSTACTLNTYLRGPRFSFHSTASRFRDTRLLKLEKSEMHRMTSNWSWTLNSQNCPAYIKYLFRGPNFVLRPAAFKVQGWCKSEIRKCTEWPETDPENLTVKSTWYTLSKYPRGPNVGPFALRPNPFRDTKLSKIGNAPSHFKK